MPKKIEASKSKFKSCEAGKLKEMESNKMLDSFIDSFPGALVLLDENLNFIKLNPAAQKILGLFAEEAVGRNISHVLTGIKESGRYDAYLQVIKTGKPFYTDDIVPQSRFGDKGLTVKAFKVGNGLGLIASEVTVRNLEQQAIPEALEYARNIIDTVPSPLLVLDADLRVSLASHSFYQAFKVTPEDTIGQFIYDLGNRQWDIPKFRHLLEDILPKHTIIKEFEVEHNFPSLGLRVMLLSACRVYREFNNTHFILLVINDITERKKAEQALHESERHYSALVQNLTDAVFLFKDGVITWCNDKVEVIYGYPKEELLGKQTSFFYPPDVNHSEFLKTVSASLREQGVYRGTATFQKKNNSIVYLEYSLSLMPSEGHVEIIAVARDITERKRAEDALRESEERYRAFVETAGQAGEGRVMIQEIEDGSASIIFVNDGFSNILGYSREETVSMSAWDLFAPDALSAFREWHRKRLNKEDTPRYYDIIGIHKNRVKVPLELSLGYLNYQGKRTTIIYFRDITERKQVEKERERLLADLAEKTRELEQIIYVTSHDLRSPLVNIQGFTRELDQSFKQVNEILKSKGISPQLRKKLTPIITEEIPYAIQHILTGSAKIDLLLSGLLRLSRLGRASLNIRQLNMNKLMSEVVASFEFQIKESKATVKVDDLPSCYGDETQINQVFSNLLDNALKFLNPKRKDKIKIWGKEETKQVIYCVEDNGIGIDGKDKEVIFEIFRRLDPEARSGEGLGLTIVRKILDRHSGRVWVESEPGKGSKFFVSLPCKEEQK